MFHALRMGKMVQIRNVPDTLHRRLKSRAALAGMSLSDYLLSEIRQIAERPTIDELRARLGSRTEAAPFVQPAEAVRAERDRNSQAARYDQPARSRRGRTVQ
jgi:plasmid stability protein